MKKYLKNIIGLLGCVLMLSCNDYLDIQPEDKYLEEDVFSTENGIQTVLNGVYSNMASESSYGGFLTMSTVEVLGQAYDLSELNHKYAEIGTYNYTDAGVQSNLDGIWVKTYTNILNINNFIASIDTYENGLSLDKKNLFKGEAIALRAMLHFDILRLFGPIYSQDPENASIPYSAEAKSELNPLLPASEVLQLILTDLNTAEQLLVNDPVIEYGKIAVFEEDHDDLDESDPEYGYEGEDFYRFRNLRLNYYAVKALQARVNLYAGNNDAAFTAAEYVINEASKWFEWSNPTDISSGSGPEGLPDRIFSSEILFGIHNTKMWDRHFTYFDYRLEVKDILAAQPVQLEANTFEGNQNDYRLNSTWILDAEGAKDFRTFNKYKDQDKQPLIKMSEMYYIAAETAQDPVQALLYLNTARYNRGLIDLPADADLNNEIYKEYRREFNGEGQLFFYYKRNNFSEIPDGSTEDDMIPMNHAQYVVPLPLSETNYR